MPKDISDDSFEKDVLQNEKPVLVDFWAPWCGPCKMMGPVLEEIDKERNDVVIMKLNVDENQQTAGQFGVRSIPTMILFKKGEKTDQIIGAMPKENLNAFIDKNL